MKNYKYVWSYEFDDEMTAKFAEMSFLSQYIIFVRFGKLFGVVNIGEGSKFTRKLNVVNVYSDYEELKCTVEDIFIPNFMKMVTEIDE